MKATIALLMGALFLPGAFAHEVDSEASTDAMPAQVKRVIDWHIELAQKLNIRCLQDKDRTACDQVESVMSSLHEYAESNPSGLSGQMDVAKYQEILIGALIEATMAAKRRVEQLSAEHEIDN